MNKVFDNIIYRIAAVMLAVAVVAACESSFDYYSEFSHTTPSLGRGEDMEGRETNEELRNVLLLYSAGFNSLSRYLSDDISDLMTGDIPTGSRSKDVLLVYSHLPVKYASYGKPNPPVLMRIYRDMDGEVVRDTLLTCPESTHSADPAQLNMILTYVRNRFPAKTYGMIFSSHATGYLPMGYYTSPEDDFFTSVMSTMAGNTGCDRGVPYVEPEHDPSLPMVKSIGQDLVLEDGRYISYEIQLAEFARALPMYLDYILFDACLMGGIEVAYELVGKCGVVGFSQTEVLAEGLDYKALPTHLLSGGTPDLKSVCMDYYKQYEAQSGVYKSATISLVDCARLEPVAEVCAELFDKYALEIAALDPQKVQRYYRGEYHWFYDLADIVAKAGASEEDIATLNEAIDGCMIYRAATAEFMEVFPIDSYSGFSMYLPCHGGPQLDKYYRTLKWNIATGLVE